MMSLQVFVLMAACAQTPVPMRFIARVLGTRPDLNSVELESVRSSALLYTPKSSGLQQREQGRPSGVGGGGDLECVSLYRGTREVFRGLFLGDAVLQTGECMLYIYNYISSHSFFLLSTPSACFFL